MKLLLAVSCLVVAVAAKPLFGTEQCANGPQVWCVDVRSAAQCGAVTHCQQNVWNKPVLKTVPCDMCKEVMTIIENFLKDNDTQSEIQAYLNKLCEMLIPDPSSCSQCKEMVAAYFPIILNILKQELGNPSVACCALHLCTSLQQHLADLKPPQQLLSNEIPDVDVSKVVYPFMANLPLLLSPQDKAQEAPKNGDVCKDCLQFVNDVQESLKTNSSFGKSLIENALKDCDLLGGVSDICKTYVNQYAEIFIQMIIQMPAQQICCTAGFCAQEKAAPMVEMTPAKVIVPAVKLQPAVKITEEPRFDTLCEVCKLILTKLEELINKNSTQEHIKEVLKEICGHVPSKYHDQCDDFIDTYSRAIIDLLEEELSPEEICEKIGCCSSQEHKSGKRSSEQIQSGGYCQVCKVTVTYMDKLLSKDVTQERIKASLQVVCDFLPDTMRDECLVFVDEYEALFIEVLLQSMDPALVCGKMGLCTNKAKRLLGSEKCMWGPSYWCKDMETAGSCNAIEHCKRHVWN